ncbi:methyltransferase [Synergistales bacterium]|nr:methyltransferase [Synergistales bacterium]
MRTCKLCHGNNISVIHKGTRDRKDIDVLRCDDCGLVFLSGIATDDSYTDIYTDSQMRGRIEFVKWRENTYADDYRRFKRYEKFMQGKSILDFGCGNGGFLELLTRQDKTRQVVGVDLDAEAVKIINSSGIECYRSISELSEVKFDIVFMFHIIEHLPKPTLILNELFEHMANDGVIVIETPNADDALLSVYKCKEFADFTYWSLHIYLYNENTLTRLIESAGCKVVSIEQEQRYPLANHLCWLSCGLPGGGVQRYQELNVPELNEAYAKVLSSQKTCDTITCTIRRP